MTTLEEKRRAVAEAIGTWRIEFRQDSIGSEVWSRGPWLPGSDTEYCEGPPAYDDPSSVPGGLGEMLRWFDSREYDNMVGLVDGRFVFEYGEMGTFDVNRTYGDTRERAVFEAVWQVVSDE